MRKLLIFSIILLLSSLAFADFLGIFDNGDTDSNDSCWVYLSTYDSLGLKYEAPDTLFVWIFDPDGDTISADTMTTLEPYQYGPGYYQRRYRASNSTGDVGQYTSTIWGSTNGTYQTYASHCWYVSDEPLENISILATSDNIGINADDVEGDFEAGDFGAGSLNGKGDWTTDSDLPANFADLSIDGSGYVTILNHLTIVRNALTAQGYTSERAPFLDILNSLPEDSAHLVDGVYAKFIEGNNEDAFKAVTAGLSTFDPSTTPVTPTDTVQSGDSLMTLADTTACQGEASSLTAELIYNYFIQGGNAEPFWADVSGCTGGGSGPLSCSLYVFDAGDTSAIQGVSVAVQPLAGGTPYAVVSTDVNGRTVMSLGAGTYAYLLFRQGKAFNAVDTITIAETQTDTLWGEDITISSPPANMTKCRFRVNEADGDTMRGVVFEWQLVDSLGYDLPDTIIIKIGNTVLSKKSKSTVSDSSYFEVNFYPNSLMNYTWTRYRLSLIYPDGTVDEVRYVEIPLAPVFDPF